jgi:alkanesulfonate monooxygenase SsuD/methylene tetrahydromethanopterin reductase-like flavin-dependent oxidoreductase (luciferase family)
MSAIAAATTRLRIIGAAIIAPLRHPLILAHQLAALDLLSEGRLVVQPTVSWHRKEYAALGVPFTKRDALLDEHLEIWRTVWSKSPASYQGKHYRFDTVYMEPKPFSSQGPPLWFGGETLGPFTIRRIVEYGHGFHPFGQPSASDMAPLRQALEQSGRDIGDLEIVGGVRPRFTDDDGPADLSEAAASLPGQLAAGYTSICFNPSQYVRELRDVPALCRQLVAIVNRS